MTRRILFLFLSCFLLAACDDPDESPTMYSAGSTRWGTRCEPFTPLNGPRFAPTDEPCLELILEGYYTRGDLTAVYFLQDRELTRSRIEFTPAGAVAQRMERGGAESRVTFQLHHHPGQTLPASDDYRIVLERAGTEVARYPFAVGP